MEMVPSEENQFVPKEILSWLFSIVVFATITGEGYVNSASKAEAQCIFNGVESACSYGVGIGVLAFLACVVFLILDAYFPQISNAKERKYIVIGDLVFSAAWTFLWFICFCVLANQWSKTPEKPLPLLMLPGLSWLSPSSQSSPGHSCPTLRMQGIVRV